MIRREQKQFALALALSIVLHALVLCIKLGKPPGTADLSNHSRLAVTLTRRPSPAIAPPAPAAHPKPEHRVSKPVVRPPQQTLATTEPARTWSQAEKSEMEGFLSELASEAKPKTGTQLEQRALAMAQTMPAIEEDDEIQEMLQKFSDAQVDHYSLNMYFEALFQRMNHAAALVPHTEIDRGRHVAAVRVVVNHDGVVNNFRILWAADQQSEIAYIRDVVDRASPFPVFPSDIRKATDMIILQVCIFPANKTAGSATFSRMTPGHGCRDPNTP